MAKDKRQRNARHLRTGSTKTRVLEWASPAQKEAFEYGPYPILASGGFNSTKTTAFILKILFLSEMYPGNRGVIARKIGKELRETTLASLLKWLPSEAYSYGGRLATTEGVIRLNNGSEILLLHLDDPETENVIRGLEINWFLLDQAEELSEEIFDLLMMRLGRWDKAVVPDALLKSYEAKGEAWPWWSKDAVPRAIPPTYGMLTCNPDHELHWLYRRFHPESIEHTEKKFLDPETDELQSYADLGYKMLFFSTLENKFLTKQQKSQLLAKDEMYQRRFVRGEWGIPEGQIHAIEKASLIAGTPELVADIQGRCKLHRGLDHGDTSPTSCGWAAVDDDQNIFVYREYYMPNTLISQHRRNIAGLSKMPNGEPERYGFQVADPSIFHKSQRSGSWWSVAQEYSDMRTHERHTAIHWAAGDKDELGTRNRISELLRPVGPRIHPITKEMGMWPRLFFITRTAEYPQGCDHIIREIKAQKRVRIGTENGKPIFSDERDDSIADHAYDWLRYLIAAGIAKPKALVTNTRTQQTFAEVLAERKRDQATGLHQKLARRLRYA